MAGAYFGPPGTDANEENPKGFWERRDGARRPCDGLLQGAGFDWFRLGGFEPSAIPDDLRQVQAEAFAHVLDDLNAHQPWVVKEPRLCLLMPVLEHLPHSAVFVHVSRDPIEVARSVHHRNNLPMAGAVALWETYTLSALSASAGRPRAHVRHEEVMADPVGTLNRLIADLEALGVTGLVAPDPEAITDFIVPSLHRQRSDRSNREHHRTPTSSTWPTCWTATHCLRSCRHCQKVGPTRLLPTSSASMTRSWPASRPSSTSGGHRPRPGG